MDVHQERTRHVNTITQLSKTCKHNLKDTNLNMLLTITSEYQIKSEALLTENFQMNLVTSKRLHNSKTKSIIYHTSPNRLFNSKQIKQTILYRT